MTVGLLELLEEHTDSGTVEVAVMLEDAVILNDLGDFATAFGVMFGLLYTLNIEYPKNWRYTSRKSSLVLEKHAQLEFKC